MARDRAARRTDAAGLATTDRRALLDNIPTGRYKLFVPTKLDRRRSESRSVEAASSREQLLAAASRVFARRGYHGASMNEIAAEAGFSKGALYWNFASKEDLFYALLDPLDERLGALVAASVTAPGGAQRTGALSRGISAVLSDNRDVVLLFHEYSALAVRDPQVAARYAERNARLRTQLAEMARARHELLGVPLAIPAERLATALIALVDGLSIQQLTEPDAVPEDLFGQIAALIEDGMSFRAQSDPSSLPPTSAKETR